MVMIDRISGISRLAIDTVLLEIERFSLYTGDGASIRGTRTPVDEIRIDHLRLRRCAG